MPRKHSLSLSPADLTDLTDEYMDNGAIEERAAAPSLDRLSAEDEFEDLIDLADLEAWDLA